MNDASDPPKRNFNKKPEKPPDALTDIYAEIKTDRLIDKKSWPASEWMSQVEGSSSDSPLRRAFIAGFTGDALVAERLRELGFVTGEELEFRGRAPFSGPWLLRLGTIVMALRDSEADCLLVVASS